MAIWSLLKKSAPKKGVRLVRLRVWRSVAIAFILSRILCVAISSVSGLLDVCYEHESRHIKDKQLGWFWAPGCRTSHDVFIRCWHH